MYEAICASHRKSDSIKEKMKFQILNLETQRYLRYPLADKSESFSLRADAKKACREYKQMINRFAKLKIVEVEDDGRNDRR